MTTTYIDLLPDAIREQIHEELKRLELSHDDIERAMCSRLSDLADTIDISKFICRF